MKKLMFLLALVIVLGMSTPAMATVISGSGTADNWLWVWTGNWSEAGTYYWKWQTASTMAADIPYGQTTTLYFAVMNENPLPTATYANPAGFLGELSTSGVFFNETNTNRLLTNTANWQVAVVPDATWFLQSTRPNESQASNPDDPTFDPTSTGLSWAQATSYGANSASGNWWGTTVSGIDGNAEWLWTENNYNDANPGAAMDHLAVFRTTVTPNVPEPVTMSLMSLGLLGLGVARRRKQ